MRPIILLAALVEIIGVFAAPVPNTSGSSDYLQYTKGFNNPTIQSSAGGKAICISGIIDVAASATNAHITLEPPKNQIEVTNFITEGLQINTTTGERYISGANQVSGTYGIYSQLCFPSATGTINTTTIQFLIHGAGYDRSYWNAAPGYSYVDYAAEEGYTTFLYDRLGVGLSDHPDPIQVVQTPLEAAVGHSLVQLLRTGHIAARPFSQVVGVGHSFGSHQVATITSQHPRDFDGVILTGFSADSSNTLDIAGGMSTALESADASIASQSDPTRFGHLPNGYLTLANMKGIQFFFFRAPQFDLALLELSEKTKQTMTIGEFLSAERSLSLNFTGPIYVVNGQNDMPGCWGDCLFPINKAAAVKEALYPAASIGSGWYLAPETGHGLNLHYTANEAYGQIFNFMKANGF